GTHTDAGTNKGVFQLLAPRSMVSASLALQTDAEAEHLGVVVLRLCHREGKVECDRSRAHCWDRDSQAQARCDAEIVQRDVLIDRTEVDERNAVNHIVSGEREQILNRVEEFEVTTDLNVVHNWRRAAEIKTAER